MVESLVGRYIKVIEEHYFGKDIKNGGYLKILADLDTSCVRVEKYDILARSTFTDHTNLKAELMPIGWTPESDKPKFEVGRWYKSNSECLHIQGLKYLRQSSGSTYFSEIISHGQRAGKEYNYGSINNTEFSNSLVEVPISEIQQYLPEGHIDKIKVDTKEGFQVGDWVVLLKTPYQGYKVGDVYQIQKLGGINNLNFSAFAKGTQTLVSGFSLRDNHHRKALPHEIPGYQAPMLDSKEMLLAEAKRRYPVSTHFKNARNGKFSYTVSRAEFYWWTNDAICLSEEGISGNGTVYHAGKWAEIISTPGIYSESFQVKISEKDFQQLKDPYEKKEDVILLKTTKSKPSYEVVQAQQPVILKSKVQKSKLIIINH